MVLVDSILRRNHSTTLEHFLAGARASGKSYESIAKQLEALVNLPGFSTTYGTIRRWCQRLGIQEAS